MEKRLKNGEICKEMIFYFVFGVFNYVIETGIFKYILKTLTQHGAGAGTWRTHKIYGKIRQRKLGKTKQSK